MKHSTIVIVAILVILILTVPISLYLLVFEKPIEADPRDIVLYGDELPCWEFVRSWPADGIITGTFPDELGGNYESIQFDFHNSSVPVGKNLSISIISFGSSNSAHDYFKHTTRDYIPLNDSLGDEGGRYAGVPTQIEWNGTRSLVRMSTDYLYREANIIMGISFSTSGTMEEPLNPDGTYYGPWMDPIVELQLQKVHTLSIHSF